MRVLAAAFVIAALGCDGESPRREPPAVAAPVAAPVTARSPTAPAATDETNIRPADYIGPAACGECHPEQHARWSQSLHATMNQQAAAPAVIGNFDQVAVPYAGGEARFTRDARGFVMTTAKAGRTVRYRVTRTIGTRGLQEYVGVVEDASSSRPPLVTAEDASRARPELRLPFGWWPRRGGWYAQPYFDPWLDEATFDAYAEVTDPWATRCPWCHSTYPFEQRIARASARRVGHGLEQYFDAPPGTDRLAVETQVTTGISCESCHLGGRAHAAGAPIHLVPRGAAARSDAPRATGFATERADPLIVGATCAQCHSGPSPRLVDGSALRNSSESLDLAASPCTGIRCIDCHDPHRPDARNDIARALAACASCHTTFANPETARVHAGHAQATCLDCHMPRMVLGIDGFVRSHRISSPTDARIIASAGPNACNLCHLERPIGWTLAELQRGWDVRVAASTSAYGARDVTVGEVWLASALPAIRLIALAAYGRTRDRSALPLLVARLTDPIAHVRAWTVFAIEDILGRKLTDAEYDPRAPAAVRTRAAAALTTTLRR